MKKISIYTLLLLFIWFSLDMIGFSMGDFILVEAAWNSIDGVWWIIFLTLSIIFILKEKIGKYLLSVFVLLWAVIQFYSHWYYTLFGASEKTINSYNQYFKETYHIIPSSKEILIPDFYHIVLHILILTTLFSLVLFIINNRKNNVKDANN
ncbi:MAG: hypothetical protein ABR596_06805 [Halarsenatibacteraceae bacterium]